MLQVRAILHSTDFSERSGYALQLASALARDYHARLILLHVVPRPPVVFGSEGLLPESQDLRAEAREQLDGLLVPGEGLLAERRVMEGDPVAVILHVARETPADLVVLGTHGRTGLGRLLMGSVAEQVVRLAPCPVLTVSAYVPASVHEPAALALGVAGPI
ncbi:universal stress protein [bacterium]|nr:universal stress protein [bacterium]